MYLPVRSATPRSSALSYRKLERQNEISRFGVERFTLTQHCESEVVVRSATPRSGALSYRKLGRQNEVTRFGVERLALTQH